MLRLVRLTGLMVVLLIWGGCALAPAPTATPGPTATPAATATSAATATPRLSATPTVLVGPHGVIAGYDSCNRFGGGRPGEVGAGHYEIRPGRLLTIDLGHRTLMRCSRPET